VGEVFCKIDAQYGRVGVGDLLTTSPTPGHAMKANGCSRAFGAAAIRKVIHIASGQCRASRGTDRGNQ